MEISHISFDTIKELYKTNKHVATLQDYVTQCLQWRFAKILKDNITRINGSVSQSEQTRMTKKQSFSIQEYIMEINLIWQSIDYNDLKYVTKNRFYKFLAENKILQNPD